MRATAATGTTTATAILPAGDMPELLLELPPDVDRAAAADEVEDEDVEEEEVDAGVGPKTGAELVDVTNTVSGGLLDWVMTTGPTATAAVDEDEVVGVVDGEAGRAGVVLVVGVADTSVGGIEVVDVATTGVLAGSDADCEGLKEKEVEVVVTAPTGKGPAR